MPDLVLASNARRTRQTLDEMATVMGGLGDVDAHFYGCVGARAGGAEVARRGPISLGAIDSSTLNGHKTRRGRCTFLTRTSGGVKALGVAEWG